MTSATSTKRIRPIAIGLIWNKDSLLVEHGFDSVKGEHFFRPPGGAIEFGEPAVDALRREFLEELDAELSEPRLITVLENLFHYEGQPHHEVVFIFEARFKDARLYQRAEFTIQEPSARATASWKSFKELVSHEQRLYPDGLTAMLYELANRPPQPGRARR